MDFNTAWTQKKAARILTIFIAASFNYFKSGQYSKYFGVLKDVRETVN